MIKSLCSTKEQKHEVVVKQESGFLNSSVPRVVGSSVW